MTADTPTFLEGLGVFVWSFVAVLWLVGIPALAYLTWTAV